MSPRKKGNYRENSRKWSVESSGEHEGFTWECIITEMGHRCGYVKIPHGHAIYKVDYQKPIKGYKKSLLANEAMGKRGVLTVFCNCLKDDEDDIGIDILFDVHGSITFSGSRHEADDWWIGFDCAHADDAPDPAFMSEEIKHSLEKAPYYTNGTIRSREYVEEECRYLCKQINKWFPKGKKIKATL